MMADAALATAYINEFSTWIDRALRVMNTGFTPYVEIQLSEFYGPMWVKSAPSLAAGREGRPGSGERVWDTRSLLNMVLKNWSTVFGTKLYFSFIGFAQDRLFTFCRGPFERGLVHEISMIRNSWAHQAPFDAHDVYRSLDTIERLLLAVASGTSTAYWFMKVTLTLLSKKTKRLRKFVL